MPLFPVRLVPIASGFSLHCDYCDCEEAELPGRSRAMAVTSAVDALAQLHQQAPGGIRQGAGIERRACAADVPMDEVPPMSWQERHGHYLRETAASLLQHAEYITAQVRAGGNTINDDRFMGDTLLADWHPAPDDVTQQVKNATKASRLLRCLAGVDDIEKDAERVVRQAEEVYACEMKDLTVRPTHYADPMQRAYAEVRRDASAELVTELRSALSKVIAHRTVRPAAASSPQGDR